MKIVIVLLLLMVQLAAFDTVTASKIFDKLFTAMFPDKIVYVYTDNAAQKEVVKQAPNLFLTADINTSDIILVTEFKDVPPYSDEKVLFSTSYTLFIQNPSVVGAFYWNKGRIKIEFLRSRLKEKNISLPKSFKQFTIDEF